MAAANKSCLLKTVDEIEASFPPQNGSIRTNGFRYATEEFVSAVYSSFKADLARYWLDTGGFGFLASDSTPLPSHIDGESKRP